LYVRSWENVDNVPIGEDNEKQEDQDENEGEDTDNETNSTSADENEEEEEKDSHLTMHDWYAVYDDDNNEGDGAEETKKQTKVL